MDFRAFFRDVVKVSDEELLDVLSHNARRRELFKEIPWSAPGSRRPRSGFSSRAS